MSYLMEDLSSAAIFSATGEAPMPTEDEEVKLRVLVTQAQNGDLQAFEALYEHYNGQICRYLSRIVDNDGIGCELTQETFLKVWSSLPGLRSPEKFLHWLYRIATNCAYTHQKKYAHTQQNVPLDVYLAKGETLYVEGPEKSIVEAEMLRLALARVSLTYRPCLILYIIDDLPQRKIAELLDIKEACVSKYVSRGLEELRQIYQQFEGQSGTVGTRGKGR